MTQKIGVQGKAQTVTQSNEPCHEKAGFLHMRISFAVTTKLISAFVFATRIVQSLFFLNQKFQASSHLLWLHSRVCVGPGWKPRRLVFSQRGSNDAALLGYIMTVIDYKTSRPNTWGILLLILFEDYYVSLPKKTGYS